MKQQTRQVNKSKKKKQRQHKNCARDTLVTAKVLARKWAGDGMFDTVCEINVCFFERNKILLFRLICKI